MLTYHNTMIIKTNLSCKSEVKADSLRSFYTTKIHDYNLKDASNHLWEDFMDNLMSYDHPDMDTMGAVDISDMIAGLLERAVVDTFPLKMKVKPPGNRIPKFMRRLMEKRSKMAMKDMEMKLLFRNV